MNKKGNPDFIIL